MEHFVSVYNAHISILEKNIQSNKIFHTISLPLSISADFIKLTFSDQWTF